MTDYKDLVERLRDSAHEWHNEIQTRLDAADALEAQQKRIEELEVAYRVETMRSARMADAMRDKDETRAALVAIQAQQDAEQHAEKAEASLRECMAFADRMQDGHDYTAAKIEYRQWRAKQ